MKFTGGEQIGRFGRWLGPTDWQRIGVVVLAIAGAIMLLQALWWLRPQRQSGSAQQRAWVRLDQRLARLRLQALPGEGPRDWQQRLQLALPWQRSAIDGFFDEFVRQSYAALASGSGSGEDQQRLQARLKALIKALPRKRPAAASELLADQPLSHSDKPL